MVTYGSKKGKRLQEHETLTAYGVRTGACRTRAGQRKEALQKMYFQENSIVLTKLLEKVTIEHEWLH